MACNLWFVIGMFVVGIIIGFVFGARVMALFWRDRIDVEPKIFSIEVDEDE